MLPKNKRKLQLQRLRSEYERVRDFSDNTIALRIRQVRLWRLFRKIQDINALSKSRTKVPRREHKSYEQIRAESLARAREIGMGYSRENGLNFQRATPIPPRTSFLVLDDKRIVESKMSTTAKRVHYGNIMSHENMRRFSLARKWNARKETPLRSASSLEMDKIEKLRKHIKYDNSNLSNRGPSKKHPSKPKGSQVVTAKVNSSVDVPMQEDFTRKYRFIIEDSSANQSSESPSESTDGHEAYLKSLWNELANHIPILSSVPIKKIIRTQKCGAECIVFPQNDREHLQVEEIRESFDSNLESVAEEYNLREIHNDLNLTDAQYWPTTRKPVEPLDDSADDIQVVKLEKLVKVSQLHNDTNQYYINGNDSEKDAARKSSCADMEHPEIEATCDETAKNESAHTTSLKNKPVTSLSARTAQQAMLMETHVKDFVKLYEPFPRFHQPEDAETAKDTYESGVEKLRSIFEHQGD